MVIKNYYNILALNLKTRTMTRIEKDIKELYKGKEVTISMDEYMSLYEIMVQATSLSEYADEGDTYNFMVKSLSLIHISEPTRRS